MTKINKNTNIESLKEFCLGEETINIFPLEIPKEGTKVDDFYNFHIHKVNPSTMFNVECKSDIKCPICEILKPKTKWQKIKERIFKLWDLK